MYVPIIKLISPIWGKPAKERKNAKVRFLLFAPDDRAPRARSDINIRKNTFKTLRLKTVWLGKQLYRNVCCARPFQTVRITANHVHVCI